MRWLQAPGNQITSTILPICALDSMRACAAAACASGKVLSITGFTLPAAISGQTFASTARAIAALSATERGAQRRAGVREALEHDAAEIDRRLRARLEGDLHDASVDGGGLVVALDVVAADHVEDDVGALAVGRRLGGGDEILGLVVDGDVGAELAAGRAFLGRAGGGDHARAERLGELDRGGADAGGAAMDQQRLARS